MLVGSHVSPIIPPIIPGLESAVNAVTHFLWLFLYEYTDFCHLLMQSVTQEMRLRASDHMPDTFLSSEVVGKEVKVIPALRELTLW